MDRQSLVTAYFSCICDAILATRKSKFREAQIALDMAYAHVEELMKLPIQRPYQKLLYQDYMGTLARLARAVEEHRVLA